MTSHHDDSDHEEHHNLESSSSLWSRRRTGKINDGQLYHDSLSRVNKDDKEQADDGEGDDNSSFGLGPSCCDAKVKRNDDVVVQNTDQTDLLIKDNDNCATSQISEAAINSNNKENTSSNLEEDQDDDDDDDDGHNLEVGDHVIRWKMLGLIYPIQIHGIVLSCGPGLVTIADFGLTTARAHNGGETNRDNNKTGGGTDDHGSALMMAGEGEGGENNGEEDTSVTTDLEAEAYMRKNQARQSSARPSRITVVTLTDEKDIWKWKRVNYTSYKKGTKKISSWFRKGTQCGENYHKDKTKTKQEGGGEPSLSTLTPCAQQEDGESSPLVQKQSQHQQQPKQSSFYRSMSWWSRSKESDVNDNAPPSSVSSGELSSQQQDQTTTTTTTAAAAAAAAATTTTTTGIEVTPKPFPSSSQKDKKESATVNTMRKAPSQQPPQKQPQNQLLQSDPTGLVLARVRFLLEHDHLDDNDDNNDNDDDDDTNNETQKTTSSSSLLLPPYHIFYSNSECIAVWCKTGRWSTLQASIFLHSTAAGNVKSTASLALFLTSQTVTVPAGGIAGFFGATTQVSLVSTQPWLLPALAGYGIVSVGAPYWLLYKCKSKWNEATMKLNGEFWKQADGDVFVECIRYWSGVGSLQ